MTATMKAVKASRIVRDVPFEGIEGRAMRQTTLSRMTCATGVVAAKDGRAQSASA